MELLQRYVELLENGTGTVPATMGAMMAFELFDPKGEFVVRQGKLPHWYQPGVTYFVTFRTDDSVPQAVLEDWRSQREA